MKKFYQSPEVEVMNFAAAENLAVIEELDVAAVVGGSIAGDIEL